MATPFKYFVGGIPRETTNDQLALALSPYGEVVEASCAHRGGIGRGFGFVTFSSAPDPLVLQGDVVVNGFPVTVKEAVSEGQMAVVADKYKYFIGGVPVHCTDEELLAAFQPFGAVKDATIVTKVDGSSRGFGFVSFQGPPSPIMFRTPVDVLGSVVTIKESVTQADMQNRKMFVGGLTVDMTEAHLEAIFSPYGTITETQVIRDANTGLSRGFGFVIFESDRSRQLALQMFPGEYEGIPLSIRRVENKTATPGAAGASQALGRARPARSVPVDPVTALHQRLAEEQRHRIALQQRLAAYEGAPYGAGAGAGAWRAPAAPYKGSGRRFKPY